ncbi:MAG: hypothetical protein KAH23_09440 [Kiritimatiellae bacterium]|nr:hypothetical protein [Kiritimatiellia bacterium]
MGNLLHAGTMGTSAGKQADEVYPDSSEETEERQETTHEMGLALLFLLSSLTPRQRQVVELYCLEGIRNGIQNAL